MRGSMTKTAVLLDRYPLWLEALENLFDQTDVEVVGKTTQPDDALALLADHRPDLLLVEVNGDRGSVPEGAGWLARAAAASPETRVVVISEDDAPGAIEAAFDAGAGAYIVKTADADDFAAAVDQALERSIFFAPSAASRSATRFEQSSAEADVYAHDLTKREVEILRLVAEGHSNAALAGMLWVTEQTVKFHLSNIYRKLDVANRTEAGRWAQVHGLLTRAEALSA